MNSLDKFGCEDRGWVCPVEVELEKVHSQLEERDRLYAEREAFATRALGLSQKQLEARLTSMNEWRQAMSDRESKYLLTIVYEKQHEAMDSRIAKVEKLLYIFMGALLLVEFTIPIVLHFMK